MVDVAMCWVSFGRQKSREVKANFALKKNWQLKGRKYCLWVLSKIRDKWFKCEPSFLKAIFHKFYLVHSWILSPNYSFASWTNDKCLSNGLILKKYSMTMAYETPQSSQQFFCNLLLRVEWILRRSHKKFGQAILKNFAKSTGKHLCSFIEAF